jgi:hypothetical protein
MYSFIQYKYIFSPLNNSCDFINWIIIITTINIIITVII